MSCEWSAIREKKVYFIRKLAKLKNISEDRKLKVKSFKTPMIKKQEYEINQKDKERNKAEEVLKKNKYAINEEEQ